ncbi:MAG: hypothetical protein HYZ09_01435 [Candidatus Kerfeldbacteria bacterium]|nr:hypothetical protein [Candidatus Kerfeldbacteria bacterium]
MKKAFLISIGIVAAGALLYGIYWLGLVPLPRFWTTRTVQNSDPSYSEKAPYQHQYQKRKLSMALLKRAEANDANRSNVEEIREALAKYFHEHRTFPETLTTAVENPRDLVTGKQPPYHSTGANYELVYWMYNIPLSSATGGISCPGCSRFMEQQPLTAAEMDWHPGRNVADRYTAIADQWNANRFFVKDNIQKTDHDVFAALFQERVVVDTLEALATYKNSHGQYPPTLNELPSTENSTGSAGWWFGGVNIGYYVCEDVLAKQPCQYQVADDKRSFTLTMNFGMNASDIRDDLFGFSRTSPGFVEGENTQTSPK